MTSDRPYRRAMPMVEALRIIDDSAGTQFCPDVVAALHRCLESERPEVRPQPVAAA
jgi:HD-GYP domain-containing protein (c-di-GMP phosphodiesterase class II)